MTEYIIRRVLQSLVIVFGLSIVFFVILHLTPGGPCAAFQGGLTGRLREQACIHRLHLDEPIFNQYFALMSGYIHGDFGTSNTGQSVTSLILQKLPPTIVLAVVSYTIEMMIAIPLGIYSALRQYSKFDQAFTFFSYAAFSMPTFWLGLILIYVFAVQWPVLPAGRVEDVMLPVFWSPAWWQALAQDPALILGDLARHLVLPVITLMITGLAADSRYMRASMLEVIHQDYIRTAKAKGLRRRSVIFKHALRNAILPIITNIALYLPVLIGGFVIVETIFSWGGIGYTYLTSIQTSDYPVVQALLILTAIATLFANLLADVVYAWVDPRIRYS